MGDAEAEQGRAAESARAHAARAEAIERALEESREACAVRDQRMAHLEAELDLSRSQAESQVRGLSLLGAELEELRITARGRATRIRLTALREAAEVSGRARALRGELDDDAEAGAGPADALLQALERAVERLGSEWDEDSERPGAGEADPADPPVAVSGPGIAASDGPPPAPESPVAPGVAARVNVDIGPFRDFSQLVSFEDAANEIGATGEISIRRFSGGRANIDVDLAEPVDLLRELEERCDLHFEVRKSSDDEIILDLGE